MEFRQIQYFIKLSESTSISQAAKELFISQQALSKSIKNLESELNTRLFLRTNQGIKLSKSGVYLKINSSQCVQGMRKQSRNRINLSKSSKGP